MGGALDWGALPVVAELLGVCDVEVFVAQLAALRDGLAEHRGGDE